MTPSPLSGRLRENAATSFIASATVTDPALKASVDQDAALLTDAANALDKAKDLLMRVYRDEDDYRTNGWFMAVEKLFPEEFPGVE